MRFANVARVIALSAACVAAIGSATSSSNTSNPPPQQNAMSSPPPAQPMDAARALGLWKSTFGAVKIEADNSKGGIAAGAIQGIWVYQRRGEEVVGYFAGSLRGNVLQFAWQEPNNPPLTGQGYLVFEASGRQYSGRWWSDHHDRVGDWNGWRNDVADGGAPRGGNPAPYGQPNPYGGATYGQPQPYAPQPQPYQPQPQPYQPQPNYGPQAPQQPAQPNPYGPQPQPQPPQQPPPQAQPRYY